jgi:hypothetical protein
MVCFAAYGSGGGQRCLQNLVGKYAPLNDGLASTVKGTLFLAEPIVGSRCVAAIADNACLSVGS